MYLTNNLLIDFLMDFKNGLWNGLINGLVVYLSHKEKNNKFNNVKIYASASGTYVILSGPT